MIAKEKLAFTKMKPICELEERHGVDLGVGYKNDVLGMRHWEQFMRSSVFL